MICRARCGEARLIDARLWHPWLRINRVRRVMLHTRWRAEAWAKVRADFSPRVRRESRSVPEARDENSSGTARLRGTVEKH